MTTKETRHSTLQVELARQVMAAARRENWPAGMPLVEQRLASQFSVSRSPMRGALTLLQEQGVVAFEANRGFRFVAVPDETDDDAGEALGPSEIETLAKRILRERATGDLAQEVSERELAERFGATRGNVRKVLMSLSSQALAQRLKGNGWRFADSLDTPQAKTESYRFRLAVECAALEEPAYAADPVELAQLVTRHHAMLSSLDPRPDASIWLRLNADFHEALARWSGNRFFHQAVLMQNNLRLLGEASAYYRIGEERMQQSMQEHLAILDALAQGDRELAALLLRRHLSQHLGAVLAAVAVRVAQNA